MKNSKVVKLLCWFLLVGWSCSGAEGDISKDDSGSTENQRDMGKVETQSCNEVCDKLVDICGTLPKGLNCLDLCENTLSQSARICTLASTTCAESTKCAEKKDVKDMGGNTDQGGGKDSGGEIDMGTKQDMGETSECPIPTAITTLTKVKAVTRIANSGRTIIAIQGEISEGAKVTLAMVNASDTFTPGSYKVESSGKIKSLCELDRCVEMVVKQNNKNFAFVARKGSLSLSSTSGMLTGRLKDVVFDMSSPFDATLSKCGKVSLNWSFDQDIEQR